MYQKIVNLVTNPYQAVLDGTLFLGTSGQNIKSIREYSDLDDELDILEKTLIWRHIAPTSPDTLLCYPVADDDPFFLKKMPHVYFAGNQSTFNTKLKEFEDGQITRLICIPEFETTFNCVLVDLNTLDCELLALA